MESVSTLADEEKNKPLGEVSDGEARAEQEAMARPADSGPGVTESAPKEPSSAESAEDVVVAVGRTADQRGYQVVRARQDRIEAGEMRPVEQGKPLQGELVRLKPRKETPHVCDVETLMKAPAPVGRQSSSPDKPRSGPAQVATATYRKNWDMIWKQNSRGSSEWN